MKVVVSLFAAFLLAARLHSAESEEARGKHIVNECVQALGGDRFLHMQTREESGRAYSFYRERLSGLSIATIYTEYESNVSDTAHQLAVRERENFGKKEDNGVLFGENEAWEITFRGARPLKADQFTRYKETTLRDVFYILRVRLNEPGLIIESRGADVIENTAVEIVDITDADNRTTTVYFDQITKLPVRQVFVRRDQETGQKDEEVTLFSKYRNVDGVQWPFAISRERNGEKIYQIFSDAVHINRSLPEKLFMLPGDIKILKTL